MGELFWKQEACDGARKVSYLLERMAEMEAPEVRVLDGDVGKDAIITGLQQAIAERDSSIAALRTHLVLNSGTDIAPFMHDFDLQGGDPVMLVTTLVQRMRVALREAIGQLQTEHVQVTRDLYAERKCPEAQLAGEREHAANLEARIKVLEDANEDLSFKLAEADAKLVEYEKIDPVSGKPQLDSLKINCTRLIHENRHLEERNGNQGRTIRELHEERRAIADELGFEDLPSTADLLHVLRQMVIPGEANMPADDRLLALEVKLRGLTYWGDGADVYENVNAVVDSYHELTLEHDRVTHELGRVQGLWDSKREEFNARAGTIAELCEIMHKHGVVFDPFNQPITDALRDGFRQLQERFESATESYTRVKACLEEYEQVASHVAAHHPAFAAGKTAADGLQRVFDDLREGHGEATDDLRRLQAFVVERFPGEFEDGEERTPTECVFRVLGFLERKCADHAEEMKRHNVTLREVEAGRNSWKATSEQITVASNELRTAKDALEAELAEEKRARQQLCKDITGYDEPSLEVTLAYVQGLRKAAGTDQKDRILISGEDSKRWRDVEDGLMRWFGSGNLPEIDGWMKFLKKHLHDNDIDVPNSAWLRTRGQVVDQLSEVQRLAEAKPGTLGQKPCEGEKCGNIAEGGEALCWACRQGVPPIEVKVDRRGDISTSQVGKFERKTGIDAILGDLKVAPTLADCGVPTEKPELGKLPVEPGRLVKSLKERNDPTPVSEVGLVRKENQEALEAMTREERAKLDPAALLKGEIKQKFKFGRACSNCDAAFGTNYPEKAACDDCSKVLQEAKQGRGKDSPSPSSSAAGTGKVATLPTEGRYAGKAPNAQCPPNQGGCGASYFKIGRAVLCPDCRSPRRQRGSTKPEPPKGEGTGEA